MVYVVISAVTENVKDVSVRIIGGTVPMKVDSGCTEPL